MTVIAFDGKTIAADRQTTGADMRMVRSKLRRLPSGEIVTWSGDSALGAMILEWYLGDRDPAKWPEFGSDEWCRFIIVGADGLRYYERYPVSLDSEDPYIAFGSGRDFAMGALAMGADARKAVEIACQFSVHCGLGVDVMEYEAPVIALREAA